ncbi:MAG TPA: PA14 domain-containing protein [Caulobacteraceae bacterium]
MTRSLRGDIYLLPGGGDHPPDFRTLRPVGAVYVRALNMPDQDWRTGLPGITSRAEWFALDYNGTFTAKTPGRYRFIPIGNDGSRLIIDGKVVVDDYGVHDAATATGEADLGPGPHRLEAQYFHGPRERLAFQLRCKGPTGPEAVFPGCGLDVGAPSLWRLWLWWVAALAALGAGVIWMTRRRLALEAHGAP